MLRSLLLSATITIVSLYSVDGQNVSDGFVDPRYAAADAHADATPNSVERSIESLGSYLASVGAEDILRARALYRWLAINVEYDVDDLLSNNVSSQSPDDVLRSRSAVCSGYSRLASALGAAMGLEVEVIDGWSKGYGYTAGQLLVGPTNHAWVAVKIDGDWRLMDPTWGAGYLNEQHQFTRRFQEHYFLTDPEDFVFDHLPEDEEWQLLDRPVSPNEFAALAYLQPMFFQAGLRVGSHDSVRIIAENDLLISLGVTRSVIMSAQLVRASDNQPLDGQQTFVQVSDTNADIHAAFPSQGDFLVRIFALPMDGEGPLQWVVDYRVRATAGSRDASFPRVFGEFGRRLAWLETPMNGNLVAGEEYEFRLRVPGASEVAVVANGEWTHLDGEGDFFTGEITAVEGDMTVCALFDSADQCKSLLMYTGR